MNAVEHRKAVQRAYAEAARRLRAEHDDEFRRLLDEVYEEQGLSVTRRASRIEVKRRQVADAERIVAQTRKGK